MDDPNMTMEEYIKLEEEKARRHAEFPTIVINDAFAPQDALQCKYQVIYLDDLKSDKDNDDDKIDIEHSLGDLSVKQLPGVINTDVGAYELNLLHDLGIILTKDAQRLKKYYGGDIDKEDDEVIELENDATRS
ncbi:hypothetical protein Tco_0545273 [Tanacetum coccineum]